MEDKTPSPDTIRERLGILLRTGFTPLDEIAEIVAEELELDPEDAAVAELLEHLLDEECEQLRLEQRSWPEVTDCERLELAFSRLEEEGIVARQNFTCCNNCGRSEIKDELSEDSAGWAFYHMQDTERAVTGGGLFIAYDAVDLDDAKAVEIGRRLPPRTPPPFPGRSGAGHTAARHGASPVPCHSAFPAWGHRSECRPCRREP